MEVSNKINQSNTYNKFLQKVNPQEEVVDKDKEIKKIKEESKAVEIVNATKENTDKPTGNNIDIKV